MKLVALSDLHAHPHRFGNLVGSDGRSSRLKDCIKALEQSAEAAKRLGARLRLFCGDLYHVRGQLKPSVQNEIWRHFADWHSSGRFIDVLMPGNHDMESRDANGEHGLTPLCSIPGVVVIDRDQYRIVELADGQRVGIGVVQYAPSVEELIKAVDKVTALKRVSTEPVDLTIMMIHHGVDGVMPGIPDMGFTSAHLPTGDFDLVFCGDYHNHKQLAPNAWMIGAPLQHNFGDAGQRRGYMVVDVAPIGSAHPLTHELVELERVPKFVAWVQGDAGIRAEHMKGNFVRVRAQDEKHLEAMTKLATESGALAVQSELVRDIADITRSDVRLSMSTADMFKTWLADRPLPEGVTTGELVSLNEDILKEAGV